MNQYHIADEKRIVSELKCYHCGQLCEETIWLHDKPFCCYGCKTVFEILSANDLCEYYALDEHAGISIKNTNQESFAYLDEKSIKKRVVEFDSETFSKVTFFIPNIHCISCIWLLENLQRINRTVLRSEVNFARKNVTIEFNPIQIKLSELAGLLSSLGYAPQINLDKHGKSEKIVDKSLLLKLSVAGFCFGNVM